MNLCLQIENIEPDKTFLVNLRELRNLLTGDTLDAVAIEVKNRLNLTTVGQQIANKLASGGKIRLVIKSILIIGAHLSQTREFRDFLEDILTKVKSTEMLLFIIQKFNFSMYNIYVIHRSVIFSRKLD
jgi:hypothetical protein